MRNAQGWPQLALAQDRVFLAKVLDCFGQVGGPVPCTEIVAYKPPWTSYMADKRLLDPGNIRPPFGNYAAGIAVPTGWRLVATSGQLGVRADDTVPEEAFAQAEIALANLAVILAVAGMGPADVVRLNAFVSDRAHMPAYMAARDAWLAGVEAVPASTLVIVSGFTRPEFKLEVEAIAAAP